MTLAPWNDPRAVWVCENHPDVLWDEGEGCPCGGAGMPLLDGKPYPVPEPVGSERMA